MTLATGVYGKFILALGTGAPNFLLNASDVVKIALVNDTETPDFDVDDDITDIGANQITGTGWAAAQNLGSPTFTHDTANNLCKLDGTDVNASTTTLTGIRGVGIYDDTVTTPTADPLICAINFGATYNTSSGTLAITWHANGLMYISY